MITYFTGSGINAEYEFLKSWKPGEKNFVVDVVSNGHPLKLFFARGCARGNKNYPQSFHVYWGR